MQKIGDIPNTRADNNGEFTDGNVAGGVPPTILPAEWFNTIQRELMSILNAAEIESDPHVFNQVLLSIQKLVSEGIPDLKDASLNQKGIVQLSNSTNSTSQTLAATPKAVSDLGNLLLKITNNLSEIKDAGPAAVAQTLLNLGLGDAAKLGVATNVQMATGTSTLLLPTVAAVMSLFNKRSFTAADYIRIPDVPGGLIIQWIRGSTAGFSEGAFPAITFPIPFPTACVFVTAGTQGNNQNTSDYMAQVTSWTQTSTLIYCQQFTTTAASGSIYPLILAIGY
ncbi:phage tail protein [Yersinia enterocolitica]|uniref:phage tail protein n=1 Tax=Yersinia enterocolitica TaxID=630 RepID=UPI003F51FEA0